jgi:hypothetical protein
MPSSGGDFSINVEGVESVRELLVEFGSECSRQAMLKALTAGSNEIFFALQAHCPELEESGKRSGDSGDEHLIDDIRRDIRLNQDGLGGSAEVGFHRQAFKAIWVEYGHWMKGHLPGKKLLIGPRTPAGFVPGTPFMRMAFDFSSQAAVDKFFESLMESVEIFSAQRALKGKVA